MPGPHQNVPMGQIGVNNNTILAVKRFFSFYFYPYKFVCALIPFHHFDFTLVIILYVGISRRATIKYFEYKSASSMLSFSPLNMQTQHRFFLESFVCHERENLVCVYVYRLYLHFNMQNNTYIFGMQKSVINGSTPPLLAQHNKIMAKLYVCMYHSIYPHGIILINMHVMPLSKMITYYLIIMCYTEE